MATKRRTPRQILADIANDEKASAASRIRAANSLLADAERRRQAKRQAAEQPEPAAQDANDMINRRAIEIAAASSGRLN